MNLEKKTIGIVGASGYGGNELVRLVLGHPHFKLVYAAADSSAGKRLSELLPWILTQDDLVIEKWNPQTLPKLDLLFVSLPSGQSRATLGTIGSETKIVDLGGDHRFVEGWTYGLADVWPHEIKKATRVANPGCYPTAVLTALAPIVLLRGYRKTQTLIADAKSGISGAGRGGGNTTSFGFAEVNEDVSAYGLQGHVHVPEMRKALGVLLGDVLPDVVFTPHLIPMTRGILATCYAQCSVASFEQYFTSAEDLYKNSPFVRVSRKPVHTKWALGSNLVFIHYGQNDDPWMVTALGALDNLVKGAAGQAVQNANLMLGLDETAGLLGAPLWP